MKRLTRRTTRVATVSVVIALLALPASFVFANHRFTDVPNSPASVHNAVSAIFNARITAGCGGTKYCPNDPVTRGQMAIFLDRLGGLSLGIGGIPRPVMDALTDQGTAVLRFFRTPVKVSGTETSFCTPDIALSQPANFGDYALIFKIYDTPVGITPAEVNVQLRDADDPPPDEYQICLARINGTDPLPDGEYKLFGTQMTDIGQGLFASGAGAAKARETADAVRTAAR